MEKQLLFSGFDNNGNKVEGLLKSINQDNATIINCNNELVIVDKHKLGRYLTDILKDGVFLHRLYSGDVIKCEYKEVESGVRFLTKDYEHLKNAKYVYSTTYFDYLEDRFDTIAWFEDENGIMILKDNLNQFSVNTNFTKYMSMKIHTVSHIKDKEYSDIFKHLNYDSFFMFKYHYRYVPCVIEKLDDFEYVILENGNKISFEDIQIPVYSMVYGKDKNNKVFYRTITNKGTNLFKFSTFENFVIKSDNSVLNDLLLKLKSTNKINDYSNIRMEYIYDNINYLADYKKFTLRMAIEYKEFYYLKNSDMAKENEEDGVYYINIPNIMMKKIALEEMNSRIKDENKLTLNDLRDFYEELFSTL